MNCFVTGRKRRRGRGRERGPSNLNLVHMIWTRFDMDIQLDPRNKLAEEFFIFSKSKMAAGGQKFATRYTFSMFLQ